MAAKKQTEKKSAGKGVGREMAAERPVAAAAAGAKPAPSGPMGGEAGACASGTEDALGRLPGGEAGACASGAENALGRLPGGEAGACAGGNLARGRLPRRSLRAGMELLLACRAGEEICREMMAAGLTADEATQAAALNWALLGKALKGDVSAYREIRELIGESSGQAGDELLGRARALLLEAEAEAKRGAV